MLEAVRLRRDPAIWFSYSSQKQNRTCCQMGRDTPSQLVVVKNGSLFASYVFH